MGLRTEHKKKENHKFIVDIYARFRNQFIVWAVRNYSCTEEEAKDVFQDVVIDFYDIIIHEKLSELTSDLKTYLFALGKYKLLNLIKKNHLISNFSEFEFIKHHKSNSNSIDMEHDEQYNKELVKKYLNQLTDDDRKVLELYYIKGYDMESIAREMNLNNSNAAKKKKFDSLKKLAKLVKKSTLILAAMMYINCGF